MPAGNRRVKIVLRYGGRLNAAAERTDQTVLVVWAAPMRRSRGIATDYDKTEIQVSPSRAVYKTRSITGVDPSTLTASGATATIGEETWPIRAAWHDTHHRNLIIEL